MSEKSIATTIEIFLTTLLNLLQTATTELEMLLSRTLQQLQCRALPQMLLFHLLTPILRLLWSWRKYSGPQMRRKTQWRRLQKITKMTKFRPKNALEPPLHHLTPAHPLLPIPPPPVLTSLLHLPQLRMKCLAAGIGLYLLQAPKDYAKCQNMAMCNGRILILV